MFQNEHNKVAFLYSFGCKVIGCLVAHPFDLSESEGSLLTVLMLPDKSSPVRIIDGNIINYVVSEIEILGTVDFQILEKTFLIESFLDISEIDIPHFIRLAIARLLILYLYLIIMQFFDPKYEFRIFLVKKLMKIVKIV